MKYTTPWVWQLTNFLGTNILPLGKVMFLSVFMYLQYVQVMHLKVPRCGLVLYLRYFNTLVGRALLYFDFLLHYSPTFPWTDWNSAILFLFIFFLSIGSFLFVPLVCWWLSRHLPQGICHLFLVALFPHVHNSLKLLCGLVSFPAIPSLNFSPFLFFMLVGVLS